MRVIIPTHRRPGVLAENTYKLLLEGDIDPSEITLFLSDSEDENLYSHFTCNKVTSGAACLRDKFNIMQQFYPKGELCFLMEDDIEALVHKSKETHKLRKVITEGFEWMIKCNSGIWGFSPHANPFYMQSGKSKNLKFIVAHAFGFASRASARLMITQHGKSDYERTILNYLYYGTTPRLNEYGPKAKKSYTGKGGLQSEFKQSDRIAAENNAVNYLVKRYPDFIMKNKSKKSIMPEVKIKRVSKEWTEMASIQKRRDKYAGW